MTSVKCDTQGLGFTLLLGTDYENKKKQLLQELQLDYKEHLTKKNDVKNCEPRLQHQGLSLPIDDRVSVKERLRKERNQEYNIFLQEQAKIGNLKRAIPSFTSKPEQIQTSDDANSTSQGPPFSITTKTNIPPPHKELPTSSRDAATLTEAIENGRRTWGWNPAPQMQTRWNVCRPKELQSSTEELNTDEEEILDLRTRRRWGSYIQDHEYQDKREAHECHVDRTFKDITDVEASAVHYQNNNEKFWKSSRQMQDSMRTAVRSTSDTNKNNAEFATGLMIGATEEQSVTQTRKEQYRQELLRQIAEQQRNKMKQKNLDMRVAATGATDPEKETDWIKQFGAAYKRCSSLSLDHPRRPRRYLDPNPRPKNDKPFEQSAPPGKFQADLSTALSQLPMNTTVPVTGVVDDAPLLDYLREDHYRDFTSMQGESAIPRVAAAAPPAPPIAANTCRTPYDDSYYYYGTRDPVDLNTPENKNCLHGGAQQSGNFSHRMSPYFRANGCAESSPFGFERLHVDTSKQRRESVVSYQEALRQQMKEKEEHKRREKEEKKLYDAKLEAEMMAYNPWGRGGAGAPIKDQNGNLVSDLNQMRKINNCNMSNPGAETKTSFSHQLSTSRHQSPLQQYQTQNTYKEDLKKQIEEKKRKEAEERERMKIVEKEEERRVAKERTRIWQEFEEERRKQNISCVTPGHQSPLQQHQTQNRYKEDLKQQIEEKKRQQAEEQERMKIAEEVEEKRVTKQRARIQQELEEERRKQNENRVPSRHQSPLQQHQTQNRCEEDLKQQIEEKKRKEAEEQEPVRTAEEEGRRVVEERACIWQEFQEEKRKKKIREREPSSPVPALKNVVTSRHSSAASQLSSRAEQPVSAPHDRPVAERNPTLNDTQQDVIKELSVLRRYLKKEQRQLARQMSQTGPQEAHYSLPYRRRPRVDAFESATKQAVQSPGKCPFHVPASVNKENIKEFKPLKNRDGCSGDVGEGLVCHQGSRQPSAETTASQRRLNCESICDSVGQREVENHSDNQSLCSFNAGSLTHQRIMRQQPHRGDHDSKSGLAVDEVDVSSLRSALGRCVSVETVATEPWLRPGTSDAVKQWREKPNSSMDAI